MRIKGIVRDDFGDWIINTRRKLEGLTFKRSEARLKPALPTRCLQNYAETVPPWELRKQCNRFFCNSYLSDCDKEEKQCLRKLGWAPNPWLLK